jgi:hypothetical protein
MYVALQETARDARRERAGLTGDLDDLPDALAVLVVEADRILGLLARRDDDVTALVRLAREEIVALAGGARRAHDPALARRLWGQCAVAESALCEGVKEAARRRRVSGSASRAFEAAADRARRRRIDAMRELPMLLTRIH